MSLEATFLQAVETAFAAADDLKTIATLTRYGDSGFNWSSQSITGTSTSSNNVEVLFYQEKRDQGSTIADAALIRTADFDGSLYDYITIGAVTYKITSFITYKFVTELQLARESRSV